MSTTPISRRQYLIGDSIAVWYNPAQNAEYDPMIERVFSVIHFVHDREQMIDFIRTIETERIFLILSGDIDQDLAKSVHDFKQIDAIYILGETRSFDEEKELKKFQGNFKSIDKLCQSAQENKRQRENNQAKVIISKLNFNEIDPSFIYSQLLKDVLLDLHYSENDKNTFAEFAKSQYPNNRTVHQDIEDFQHDREYSPIWWYTRESIFYSMLNGALRNQDVDVLHKLGFFIRDLHRQLHQLQRSAPFRSSMIVYRGQGLNSNVFKQIQSIPNGLISFHHFLSTSWSENVARLRAESTANSDELVGILFQMTIDPSINDIPFASIDNQSAFGSVEAEVLFSINTIFRIGQIEPLGPNLYRIHLTLICNDDQEIQQLTQYLREEINVHDDPLYRFGQLTLRMQEWMKAKEIYQKQLNKSIDNRHTEGMAHSYHQLGYIHFQSNDFDTALDYLQKSLNILGKRRKLNGSTAADTYSMIGQVLFEQKKDLQAALDNMQQALTMRLREYKPEPQTLAKNYAQIGKTLLYLKRHNDALVKLDEALKIQLDSLPKYHMDLASTYSTISHVYHDMENYEQGLSYCEKALDIYQRCLRHNHPSLATVHTNMANNLGELKRFDKAIFHAKEAIEISLLYLPSYHKDIKERERILYALQTTQKYYQNLTMNNSQ